MCGSPPELDAETPHAEEPKGVLILYKDEMSFIGERAADNGIRSVLGNDDIQLYSEHLDTHLFPDPKFQAATGSVVSEQVPETKNRSHASQSDYHHRLFPDIPDDFLRI